MAYFAAGRKRDSTNPLHWEVIRKAPGKLPNDGCSATAKELSQAESTKFPSVNHHYHMRNKRWLGDNDPGYLHGNWFKFVDCVGERQFLVLPPGWILYTTTWEDRTGKSCCRHFYGDIKTGKLYEERSARAWDFDLQYWAFPGKILSIKTPVDGLFGPTGRVLTSLALPRHSLGANTTIDGISDNRANSQPSSGLRGKLRSGFQRFGIIRERETREVPKNAFAPGIAITHDDNRPMIASPIEFERVEDYRFNRGMMDSSRPLPQGMGEGSSSTPHPDES